MAPADAAGNLTPIAYAARNASVPQQAGALRFPKASRPGLLQHRTLQVQMTNGFYSRLDESWGSGQTDFLISGSSYSYWASVTCVTDRLCGVRAAAGLTHVIVGFPRHPANLALVIA